MPTLRAEQTLRSHLMKPIKKASWFGRQFISARMLFNTLIASFHSLIIAYFGKNKRKRADARIDKWSGQLLRNVKMTYEVFNAKNFSFKDSKPYVVMSNHLSHLDIPLIFQAFPKQTVRMLTKKELFKVPLWGTAMKVAEFISIDRKNQRQAMRDLATAKEAMLSGIRLWISPEGTRARNSKLQNFKRGGFKIAVDLGAMILPVGIRGSNKGLPPDRFEYYKNVHAEVHIGEPIDASKFTDKTLKELIEKVRDQIATLAGPEYV